jgi:hypothetical protein
VRLIIVYLAIAALTLTTAVVADVLHLMPRVLDPLHVVIACGALGGLGGCVYCLRGVYLMVPIGMPRWRSSNSLGTRPRTRSTFGDDL